MPPMLLWFAHGRPKSEWELYGEERAAIEREREMARLDERQLSLQL